MPGALGSLKTISGNSPERTSVTEETEGSGSLRIHRRQFVIGPRPIDSLPGWLAVQLPGCGYLSHCPELRVASRTDAGGNIWYLLGIAVQTMVGRPDPIDEIGTFIPETIQDMYHSWAGRWMLVGNGEVHMDCSGLLGCFYRTREVRGTGEELWLSSSPAIVADLLGVDTQLSYRIEHGYGFDWYLPPRSGIESISRLLPSQVLHLSNGKVSPRRLLAPLSRTLNYEEVLDELQTYFTTAIQNVSRISDRLRLPLTGGYDSRTLLAVALHAGVPVSTFTHGHTNLAFADLTLPPKIAETVGLDHVLYEGGEYSQELADMYDRHTAGHSVDRDRFYFAHNYFEWCRKGDMILRGNCFEIGRGFRERYPVEQYGPELPDAEAIINEFRVRGFKYAGRDPAGFFPPPLCQAMEDWVTWSESIPPEDMDWRDRFFLDQRLAGWLSSIEQSLDLIDADRFYAANSHRFCALVLQIPEQKRLLRLPTHQIDLIRRMAPELLQFPFNPPRPISFRRRLWGKLKSLITSPV